jgi:spore maturation protein CgeB
LDLSKFYTPGVEIETYASTGEMLAKIDYFLSHEQDRREIALRALARTMREHTYAHRLNQVLNTIFG